MGERIKRMAIGELTAADFDAAITDSLKRTH